MFKTSLISKYVMATEIQRYVSKARGQGPNAIWSF